MYFRELQQVFHQVEEGVAGGNACGKNRSRGV